MNKSYKIREKQKKKAVLSTIKKSFNKERIGILHIKSCRNNTIFTLTDLHGNALSTITGGRLGYKNAQKKTWTTVRECAYRMGKKARATGYRRLYLNLRGFSPKQKSAFLALRSARCKIERIIYRTALPHNGCRIYKKGRK